MEIISTPNYCSTCGQALDPAVSLTCPHCAPPERSWGPGAGILTWVGSVLLIIGFQVLAIMVYLILKIRETGQIPKVFELDWLVAVLSIASTFPAHLLTLLLCWLVVTGRGRRPFFPSIGWQWHEQFKWVHAIALAFLMMGVAIVLEKLLPHRETDMEKLLKMGASIRYMVAILAVFTAPLVEELVYRGVLYAGIERAWGKWAGVGLVTFLFALVHVPQYWGSYAAITAIVSLSLVLTLLRAYTGKLLPCIATHLVYNGVQAVTLLVGGEVMLDQPTAKTAMTLIGLWPV